MVGMFYGKNSLLPICLRTFNISTRPCSSDATQALSEQWNYQAGVPEIWNNRIVPYLHCSKIGDDWDNYMSVVWVYTFKVTRSFAPQTWKQTSEQRSSCKDVNVMVSKKTFALGLQTIASFVCTRPLSLFIACWRAVLFIGLANGESIPLS